MVTGRLLPKVNELYLLIPQHHSKFTTPMDFDLLFNSLHSFLFYLNLKHLDILLFSKNFKIKIYLYKIVILHVVLYGRETWFIKSKEEYRLKVFENRILRRIFGPKTVENGKWRRLHNEELHSLYRSPNIVRVIKSRRLRWAGHIAKMEEGRSAFKILTGTPIGKRLLGRPRRRWEDTIRIFKALLPSSILAT